jgi:hypothetical protein
MKLLTIAFCLLACAASLPAQSPIVEQGGPDELKGVKTVFVDADSDLEARDEIGGEIKDKLPGVKVLLDAKGAEVVLRYKVEVETGHGGANPRSVIRKVAVGEVVKPLERNRERRLMEFRKPLSGSSGFSGPKIGWGKKHPGRDFAREFIKAWQKANPQK